jgi:hypothetical protein
LERQPYVLCHYIAVCTTSFMQNLWITYLLSCTVKRLIDEMKLFRCTFPAILTMDPIVISFIKLLMWFPFSRIFLSTILIRKTRNTNIIFKKLRHWNLVSLFHFSSKLSAYLILSFCCWFNRSAIGFLGLLSLIRLHHWQGTRFLPSSRFSNHWPKSNCSFASCLCLVQYL